MVEICAVKWIVTYLTTSIQLLTLLVLNHDPLRKAIRVDILKGPPTFAWLDEFPYILVKANTAHYHVLVR